MGPSNPAAEPILIVEDDESTAELVRRSLARSGRTTRIVSRADEATKLVSGERFMLIILDYRLKDGLGWPVLEAARAAVPRVPVIVVTAMGDERVAAEAIHRGASDYLIKSGTYWEQLPQVADRVLGLVEADRANALLASIVEASDDAIIGRSLDGAVTSWNAGAEKMYGYSSREAVGGTFEFLVPPDRRGELALITKKLQSGEGLRNFETVRFRKDGTEIHVSITVSPIRNKEGQIIGGATISRDISERFRAEETLRQSEARFRGLAESSLFGVLFADLQGNLFDANDAFLNLLGYTRADLPLRWDKMTTPDEQGIRELRTLGRMNPIEKEFLGKDGRKVALLIGATMLDKQKEICVAVAVDLSSRKRLEEELRQAQKMEVIGRLAGGVAHDFNNLLTPILGYSQLILETSSLEKNAREELEEIGTSARRAAELTRQLLAFSRKQVLQPKVLELNQVVSGTEKLLRRLIGEDVKIAFLLAPRVGPIKVDPGQLEQVVMNLAINARDAMPQGGRLTIETADVELDEEYARTRPEVVPGLHSALVVSDTGTGMDKETLSHLFEPFFTTKPKGKGTGLGLAMVYGIVKQSRGNIHVYSEPGHGTTFKVYFPHAREAAEREVPKQVPRLADAGSETILLVEDDPTLRNFAMKVLKLKGYTVLEAESGDRALAVSNGHAGRIHLMLTDVVMPGISGREAANRIQQTRPEIKALYMSGYTGDAIVHHGVLEEGMVLLQKPFTPAGLARKIRDVLDGLKA